MDAVGRREPALLVSSRRYAILSSTKLHESHTRLTPVPADVMHAPLSGLPSAPTTVRGIIPFAATCVFSRMTGLKLTLVSRGAKSCAARKSSSAGYESAVSISKLPPTAIWVRSATARVFAMILSNVPCPPRSGRDLLCASRSPSSVILMPFNPSGLSRSTISRVISKPLVMMLMSICTPRALQEACIRSER